MRKLVLLWFSATAFLMMLTAAFVPPASAAGASCQRPVSVASSLSIAANDMPGGRQPQAPEHLAAAEDAIETWHQTLAECLNGAVTLTYVPIARGTRARSDIVVHLVQHAGGSRFGGQSECGPQGCSNVLVAYVASPGRLAIDPVAPTWHTEGIALHEIGHALGLGHADNLWEGTDLMAYGWASPAANFGAAPPISQCDVDGLAYVWSWAIDGTAPTRPAASTCACTPR